MKVADYRLSAALDKERFKTEESIQVLVTFENTTDNDASYGAQGKDFDYILDCRDGLGNPVPPTLYGQRIASNRGMGRYINASLPPKGRLVNRISVTRLCDLSLPGRYTLKVTREVFPQRGHGEPPLAAPPLSFEIIEE